MPLALDQAHALLIAELSRDAATIAEAISAVLAMSVETNLLEVEECSAMLVARLDRQPRTHDRVRHAGLAQRARSPWHVAAREALRTGGQDGLTDYVTRAAGGQCAARNALSAGAVRR